MGLVGDTLTKLWVKGMALVYRVVPNPSGQDQIQEHMLPAFFFTTLLLSIPSVDVYVGLIWPLLGLYIELVDDGHWRDFFKRDDGSPYGPADGRCDLFFRELGCALAYGVWALGTFL